MIILIFFRFCLIVFISRLLPPVFRYVVKLVVFSQRRNIVCFQKTLDRWPSESVSGYDKEGDKLSIDNLYPPNIGWWIHKPPHILSMNISGQSGDLIPAEFLTLILKLWVSTLIAIIHLSSSPTSFDVRVCINPRLLSLSACFSFPDFWRHLIHEDLFLAKIYSINLFIYYPSHREYCQ